MECLDTEPGGTGVLFALMGNTGIQKVRREERRILSGYSETWNIVSKKGNTEIKPFFFFFLTDGTQRQGKNGFVFNDFK